MKNKMATPLGTDSSTAKNQVSQCDEQTFGSNSEFRKAGATRASLAKSSRKVSAETEKVSANLLRSSGATRKHARSPSPSPSRTWWFSSIKEDSKKSSLGVV